MDHIVSVTLNEDIFLTSCFGKVSIDSLVCGGKGKCVSSDLCQCNNGYTGIVCSISLPPMCGGRNSSDPTVCGGKGKCVSYDYCVCDPGFRLSLTSSSVCVEGNSTGPSSTCSYGWTGVNCTQPSSLQTVTVDAPNVCNGK